MASLEPFHICIMSLNGLICKQIYNYIYILLFGCMCLFLMRKESYMSLIYISKFETFLETGLHLLNGNGTERSAIRSQTHA